MTKSICTYLSVFLIILFLPLSSCQPEQSDVIRFAISAEYPPFAYKKNGKLIGLDIELAKLIGKTLRKKIDFQDMQFSSILAAIQSDRADAGISTITITEKRKKCLIFYALSYRKHGYAI